MDTSRLNTVKRYPKRCSGQMDKSMKRCAELNREA
ncbi:hypothetical protein J2T14_005767 [Paenibacillus harenae]|nr:hypothetical protein [Paenibacillus harenae]